MRQEKITIHKLSVSIISINALMLDEHFPFMTTRITEESELKKRQCIIMVLLRKLLVNLEYNNHAAMPNCQESRNLNKQKITPWH